MTILKIVHFIINAIIFCFAMGMIFSLNLIPRWSKFSRIWYALFYLLIEFPSLYVRTFYSSTSIMFIISDYYQLITNLIFIIFFFKDKIWKKLLLFFLCFNSALISQYFTFILFRNYNIEFTNSLMDFDSIIMNTFANFIIILLLSIIILFWNRFLNHIILPK